MSDDRMNELMEDPRTDPRDDTTIPLREGCRYSLLVPTSMGIRLTPAQGQPMHCSDLLTMQVDGTEGSAIVGLRKCWVQHQSVTPRPIWNPDIDSPIDYYANWTEVPDQLEFDNAFKIQWEMYLKHVAIDEPFKWTLREGAKGVQLAELSIKSHQQGRWMDVPK